MNLLTQETIQEKQAMKTRWMFKAVCRVWMLTLLIAWAQAHAEPKNKNERKTITISYWSWLREEWTADEQPYRRIRAAVDKIADAGRLTPAVVRQYKARAKNWTDPVAQFRWGYAAYKLAKKADFVNQAGVLQEITDALQTAWTPRPQTPRSYEYARLRFLVMGMLQPDRDLRVVGERLLSRNPNDYEVEYLFVSVLSPGITAKEKQQALFHIQALLRKYPQKRARIHSLLGGVHYKLWVVSQSQADADKAVAAYRQYLRLASPHDKWRQNAMQMIKHIQQRQARAKRT